MSHVIVTGAQGFVGQVLVKRLLQDGLDGKRIDRLTLMDVGFPSRHPDTRVNQVTGNIHERSVRAIAYSNPVDALFHLASVPGGASERNYELGRAVNLDATMQLLQDLRGQDQAARFVFASTIAVYGEQLPATMNEQTLPAPVLSYGAHKLIGESLVADASRLGWVQGCSLRLPGVVARPGDGAGMMSAFMSLLFWRIAANQPITLPVSADGVAWWISVEACVDNLIHAATVDPGMFNVRRTYQMPVLRLTMAEVVEALVRRFGAGRESLVSYSPDPFIQRLFASYPPLSTPEAEALGLRSDGTVDRLVERAMAG